MTLAQPRAVVVGFTIDVSCDGSTLGQLTIGSTINRIKDQSGSCMAQIKTVKLGRGSDKYDFEVSRVGQGDDDGSPMNLVLISRNGQPTPGIVQGSIWRKSGDMSLFPNSDVALSYAITLRLESDPLDIPVVSAQTSANGTVQTDAPLVTGNWEFYFSADGQIYLVADQQACEQDDGHWYWRNPFYEVYPLTGSAETQNFHQIDNYSQLFPDHPYKNISSDLSSYWDPAALNYKFNLAIGCKGGDGHLSYEYKTVTLQLVPPPQ